MSPFSEFITPARRQREEDESDFDVSVDGEGSERSSASKRRRLNANDSDDEVSETQEGDLLPDSFRRSPQGKRATNCQLANGQTVEDARQTHQPGSIVRVKLTDFVTYTRAEFHPGPNLNMIIGPNGTGKSTLVCAICLGLGWSTSHLGRAKDLGEFVKHGSRRGEIEIELAADPDRHEGNPVIRTRITKEGNKADYYINGKKSTRKGVQELARSFSIQVDNLCQFLPQDRVVEFAALSPIDLLTQTQRAAAPQYMSEWHDQLKELRREQKQQQNEQQGVMETLKGMEDRQRLQEADVTRLRERADITAKIAALKKLRPFPEYTMAKMRHLEAKDRKKAAEKSLRLLEQRVAPNLEAANEKQEYAKRVEKVVAVRRRLVERGEGAVGDVAKKIKDAEDRLQHCANEIDAEKNSVRATRQTVPKLQQGISAIQRALQSPPEEFDSAEMNARIREKHRLEREVQDRLDDALARGESTNVQVRQRHQIIENKEREKNNLRSQAGQQANKLRSTSKDAAEAWDWIQRNRDRFQGKVYGPPIVECTVKDAQHAAAVESMISMGDNLSFTVTSQADLKMLLDQVSHMRLHDINIRVSLQPMSAYQQPSVSPDQLKQLGLNGWLLDLLDGPEEVLAMLCDNRSIHQMAYATREISEAQFNALKRSQISSWVTPSQSYQINRRREYGDAAVSTRVQPLRQARFFTNVPVDRQAEQDIERAIGELKVEIEELNRGKSELQSEMKGFNEERKALKAEQKALEDEKNSKQSALSQFNGLTVKLDSQKAKLEKAKEAIAGYKERVTIIADQADKLYLDKGQLALDYANAIEALRSLHLQLFEVEVMHIEAKSDAEQLTAQHAEEVRLLDERRKEVEELQAETARSLAEGKRLGEICKEIGSDLTAVEREMWDLIEGSDDGEEKWTAERLDTEVQAYDARLEMTHGGGNENTIRDFERRAADIDQKRARLNALDSALDQVAGKIAEIRSRWEPELDALIGKISEAFKHNFEKINCAGEVAVHKDDEFEQWAIQIRVKFRENEQLSVLDSHRQSGGERAVSTIFYLMALQSLARAPFRVVDEINQGMDPRNERLVHGQMVDIACNATGEDGRQGSQYFLITPKLLSGLKYHRNMKVHCIASGEYMPSDPSQLDFEMLAKKALALREGSGVGISAAG